nr:MAG TPA: repressor domain protein [Caudoviricetes sp.]
MDNNIKIFENNEFGKVRTVILNDEPWFVGKDVAEILGYHNPNEAIQDHVDDEDKFIRSARGSEMLKLFSSIKEMQEKLGRQDNWFISESGVYSLIFGSKLPTAKKFKRWVTSEVLPSIRKHGAYMTEDTIKKVIAEPDFIIQIATELKKEKEQNKQLAATCSQQQQMIGELKPKADYVDRILKSDSLVTITQIAKDYGMSGKAMNKALHDLHIIYNCNRQWLLYSQHQAKGYTFSETVDIPLDDGTTKVVMNTKWTQKGRLFLYEMLKKHGVIPLIEKQIGA